MAGGHVSRHQRYRELMYEAWDWELDRSPTPAELRALLDDAQDQIADEEGKTLDEVRIRPFTGQTTLGTVREWMEHPERYTPFVDETAIVRALAFDWGVIENLSDLEREVLVRQLAVLDDPFESQEARYRYEGAEDDRSERRKAFDRGTRQQKEALQAAVRRYRQRCEGVAA